MNRPEPIHSDAPDDKAPAEKWVFWIANSRNSTVTVWVTDDSGLDDDNFLSAWGDENCTRECIINLNHVYFGVVK